MSSSRVCVCSPDRLEAVSQVWEVLLVWEVLEFTSDPHPWFLGVPFFWSRRSLRGTELPYIDIA